MNLCVISMTAWCGRPKFASKRTQSRRLAVLLLTTWVGRCSLRREQRKVMLYPNDFGKGEKSMENITAIILLGVALLPAILVILDDREWDRSNNT